MSVAEMQRHVADNAAVMEAWIFVKNKFADLNKNYEFGVFAAAMESCTRTSKDTKILKLHLHAWFCRAREQRA